MYSLHLKLFFASQVKDEKITKLSLQDMLYLRVHGLDAGSLVRKENFIMVGI